MNDQCRNVLLTRLLDALESYYRHVSAEDDDGRRAFRDVAAWFESTDSGDPYGFEGLCTALDFDAEQIRLLIASRRAEIRGGRVPPRKR